MTKKLINKLNPYEIFLMEAAGENTNKLSEISVKLIVPKPQGAAYLKMNVPEEMKGNFYNTLNLIRDYNHRN